MSKKLIAPLIILGTFILILLACLGCYLSYKQYLSVTPTLSPPLANVEFLSEQEQYPADWPDEFKFPKEFVLVDSSSGVLPESAAMGWSAKLRYSGQPSDAVKAITAFFDNKGWTIVESNQLDTGGFSLLIQRAQGSGIVVIDGDPNNSSQTLIIATLFP